MKVNWNDAPDWASMVVSIATGRDVFSNGVIYELLGLQHEHLFEFEVVEVRPNNWKEGEKRMEPIGQNGNEGEHYAELEGFNQKTDFNKQEKYGGEKGDFIDDFYEENSAEKFRGAMEFTIQKYWKRMGKKDDVLLELYKIADYSMRFYEKEKLRRAIELESDK